MCKQRKTCRGPAHLGSLRSSALAIAGGEGGEEWVPWKRHSLIRLLRLPQGPVLLGETVATLSTAGAVSALNTTVAEQLATEAAERARAEEAARQAKVLHVPARGVLVPHPCVMRVRRFPCFHPHVPGVGYVHSTRALARSFRALGGRVGVGGMDRDSDKAGTTHHCVAKLVSSHRARTQSFAPPLSCAQAAQEAKAAAAKARAAALRQHKAAEAAAAAAGLPPPPPPPPPAQPSPPATQTGTPEAPKKRAKETATTTAAAVAAQAAPTEEDLLEREQMAADNSAWAEERVRSVHTSACVWCTGGGPRTRNRGSE